MMSRRIVRQLRKTLGIDDAEKSFARLEELAQDESLPEELRNLAGRFRGFVASVNEAYSEDDGKIRLAVRNLDISSEELNVANEKLYRLNITNKAMLESLGQALLFFGKDGICADVFSEACLTLLEGNPSGRHICDVLKVSPEKRANFEPLISLLFEGDTMALSFTDLIGMAPQSYPHSQGLDIALSYKAMYSESGKIVGILLVATDITQKVKAQEKLQEKEQQVMRTLRIAGNRGNYVHTLQSFRAVFSTLDSAQSLGEVRRNLHTLKGMARVFYLDEMAGLLHEMEDALAELPHEGWHGPLKILLEKYDDRLDLAIDYARWLGREIWGEEFESVDDFITIDTRRLYVFGQTLKLALQAGGADPEKLAALYYEQVASVTVMSQLAFFETQLLYFAEVADRQVRIAQRKGGEVRIFPDIYRPVFDSLTHAARNIVDHAFETPERRAQLGKPPELQVKLRAAYDGEDRKAFRIEISDDGPGISAVRIAERLRQKNPDLDLEGVPDEEIIQHVFDEAFSTRSGVSIDSGRGIGMNAIRDAAARLGGTARVDSREDEGTTLILELPVIWDKN